jgi:hypothetical protein
MDDTDRPRFAELVTVLAMNYRVEASTALFQLMWEGLEDLPYDKVRAACQKATREEQWMPTVALLRALARPVVLPYHLPAEPQIEAMETCNAHRMNPRAPVAELVPWCRKCKRLGLPGMAGGPKLLEARRR